MRTLAEITDGATCVISHHGITVATYSNATCTFRRHESGVDRWTLVKVMAPNMPERVMKKVLENAR